MPIAETGWPNTVPLPELGSASMQTFDTHTIYETNDLDPIRVFAWKLKPAEYQCEVIFRDSGQWLAFEQFYEASLRSGNVWFNIALALGGGIRNCLCAFKDAYTVSQIAAGGVSPAKPIAHRCVFTLLVYQQEQRTPPRTGA